MPALDGLTFSTGSLNSPSLNNRSEVEVGVSVKDAAGKTQTGGFLRDAQGKLLRVALPRQELPGGSKVTNQNSGLFREQIKHGSSRLKRQVKSVLCRMECPLLSLHNIKGVAVHKAYLLALRHPDKVSGNVHPGARL